MRTSVGALLLLLAGCGSDCTAEPAAVDRSSRPSPIVPAGDRTHEASLRARPAWARDEDERRRPTRLEGHEARLRRVFEAAEQRQAELTGDAAPWLCHVRLLVSESDAEGLFPFSDPDLLLRGKIGARPFEGAAPDDLPAGSIAIAWARAARGDRVAFEVLDRDALSGDDRIASLDVQFDTLPIEVGDPKVSLTCRGIPEALWAPLVEDTYDDLERTRAIADAARRTPGGIQEGYPMLQVRDMRGALRLIAEVAGWQHPYVAAGDRALTATLARLAIEFPPAPAPSGSVSR